MKEIYEAKFIEKLFDKISNSYSKVNYVTSFGFGTRWRKQCVDQLQIEEGKVVVDLMTGMGECWEYILKNESDDSKLIGLDFSSEMIKRAEQKKLKFSQSNIELLREDVFENSIESGSADYVISGFGLKTFNDEQFAKFANEIDRLLKPNGKFSLVEISVPKIRILKPFFMFYVKTIIPTLGRIFLGSPENYKMLGIYAEKFQNSKKVYNAFKKGNFEVEYVEYFFGCATGIKGVKK